MITKKQKQLLESLISTGKSSIYSKDDYDIMGIYGHSYKPLPEDDDCYYDDEDEEDEEVPY